MLSDTYSADFSGSRILEPHIVDMDFKDAGLPKDQIYQVWFL